MPLFSRGQSRPLHPTARDSILQGNNRHTESIQSRNGGTFLSNLILGQVELNVGTQDDTVAEVNYFTYDQNQWVSYDDVNTLKAKIDYANKNGLQGIFIWAVDLDDDRHSALDAVLDSVGGLGYFNKQNGVGLYGPGVFNTTEWRPATGTCYSQSCLTPFPPFFPCALPSWSNTTNYFSVGACGTNPGCPVAATAVGPAVLCDAQSDGTKLRRRVCCPYVDAPSGATCEWSGCKSALAMRKTPCYQVQFILMPLTAASPHFPICHGTCEPGYILIAGNDWYVVNNDDAYCFKGNARYCCKAVRITIT